MGTAEALQTLCWSSRQTWPGRTTCSLLTARLQQVRQLSHLLASSGQLLLRCMAVTQMTCCLLAGFRGCNCAS